jgi:antitoxin CcdA
VDDAPKVRVEVELDKDLVDLAAKAGLDLNEVTDRALQRALGAEKRRRWREENAEAIAFNNAQVERDGLWCDEYRLF